MVWQEITATILEAYQLQLILKTTDKYKDRGFRKSIIQIKGQCQLILNRHVMEMWNEKSKKKKEVLVAMFEAIFSFSTHA